jgi:hypothetical protein
VLPELSAAPDATAVPDVVIERAELRERLSMSKRVEPCMQVGEDEFQFNSPVARLLVRGGRLVLVDAAPGADARDVRLYLLGTVMVGLCHQRGRLPLHAMAVAGRGGAVAVGGLSGVGKSTLAAQLLQRGHAILADDLCALEFDSAEARLHPGPARIKLWADSIASLGLSNVALPQVLGGVGKFSLACPQRGGPRGRKLERIYILSPAGRREAEARCLSGPAAVDGLLTLIHHWSLATAMGRAPRLFAQIVSLVTHIAIYELRYAQDRTSAATLPDFIEAHASL